MNDGLDGSLWIGDYRQKKELMAKLTKWILTVIVRYFLLFSMIYVTMTSKFKDQFKYDSISISS